MTILTSDCARFGPPFNALSMRLVICYEKYLVWFWAPSSWSSPFPAPRQRCNLEAHRPKEFGIPPNLVNPWTVFPRSTTPAFRLPLPSTTKFSTREFREI